MAAPKKQYAVEYEITYFRRTVIRAETDAEARLIGEDMWKYKPNALGVVVTKVEACREGN